MIDNQCPDCNRETVLGEAEGDRFYCEYCKKFFGSIKESNTGWLCAWCKIYGKYPMSKAYHPDDEEGVLTDTGEKICKTCATNWRKGKKKDKQRDKNGTIQETSTT